MKSVLMDKYQNFLILLLRMEETFKPLLKKKWAQLQAQLETHFGEKPDLQVILFLIGVQELGKGNIPFSKEQKQDLMHIAVCKVLSRYGHYEFEGYDNDGWPHWRLVEKIPNLNLAQQDMLLHQAVVDYFEESGFLT